MARSPRKCQQILGKKGRLSKTLADFVPRAEQLQLAQAIEKTIEEKTILIAEAGTGTGKTFAYLVPCLLSGKKALISTATKTLQDQLFQKDLPLLLKVLGLSLRIQNLKGRSNYICRYRVALHAETGRFTQAQISHEVGYVREKLPQLTVGERAELAEISEESLVWPYVTSTADNCLGSECSEYGQCFLVKARKRAIEADVVVINHHLYFADSQLKEEGLGELLPDAEIVIFDEAHQLTEIAAHFQGARGGTRQCRDLLDDMLREWPVLDLANQPLQRLSHELDMTIDNIMIVLGEHEERCLGKTLQRHATFTMAWESLIQILTALANCFNDSIQLGDKPGLARCKERLTSLKEIFQTWGHSDQKRIQWIERFKHHVVFHITPVEVADTFRALLAKCKSSYIFTSATLTMANSFDCFKRSLGLENASTLQLPSPFNYQEQALLYLPRGLPDPKHPLYTETLMTKVLPIINACGGRCFFLFTSHKALQQMAALLVKSLSFPLLIQGEEAKPILLNRFRHLGNAVLLGTATFWEGVDVKGEALSCVIIDKLPFSSPHDPVMRGRMNYLKSRGLSDFDELALPEAVLALKQGVGRLIRDTKDKGLLMIADPRLTARPYGQRILTSLPAMQKTRNEQTALTFIRSLALSHETISA